MDGNNKKDFENIVKEAINEILEFFKSKIDNLEFIVMEYSTKKMHMRQKIF